MPSANRFKCVSKNSTADWERSENNHDLTVICYSYTKLRQFYVFIYCLETIPTAHFSVLLAVFHCQLMCHLHMQSQQL